MQRARRRCRTAISALTSLVVIPLLLAGCIGTPIEVASHPNGSVTMTWGGTADGYDSGTGLGDTIQICSASASLCDPTSPDHLYVFYPADFSTEATLAVGTPVEAAGGGTVALPAGAYTLQVVWVDMTGPFYNYRGSMFSVTISATSGARPVWLQSFARASADETCPHNWAPSWAQWPQDGAGGYVCDRTMYADAPDEQVPNGPRAAQGAPWLQSVPRDSEESECPDGWTPSWAPWPQDGAGGFTCDRLG